MKRLLTLCATIFLLTACSPTQTSIPVPETVENTPAPFSPDTPSPARIDAPRIENPALVELQFINELEGWGVTESQIARTNDGGLSWYDVTPPDMTETGYTVEVFFLDQEHAWIQSPDFENFPNNGQQSRTSDGGLTWTITSTPFSTGELEFVNAQDGWMLADLGIGAGSNAVAVYQTTNGGGSWDLTYINDPNHPQAGDSLPLGGLKTGIAASSMQTAWVGGVIYSPGELYLFRTDNAGAAWSRVVMEMPAGWENAELSIDADQMEFVSAGDGFLAVHMAGGSTQTAIYVTRDGGASWTLTPTLIPDVGSAEFPSATEAVIFNGEQFYVTRDAGRTWSINPPNILFGESYAGMDFVNARSGWVITVDPASNQRSLYRTFDGGVTWLPILP